jgi:hypothetical protein
MRKDRAMRVRAAAFWLLGAFQGVGCRSILDIHDHEVQDAVNGSPSGSSAGVAPDASLPDSANSSAGEATQDDETLDDDASPEEGEPAPVQDASAQVEDASDSGAEITDADVASSDKAECSGSPFVLSDAPCAAGPGQVFSNL